MTSTLDFFLPPVDPALDALHRATACYTREAVVDQVLDAAGWPEDGGRLLDPGAGDGVFLERAIARLSLTTDDVESLADRAEGWEIHPIAASLARERIARHLARRGWSPGASHAAARRVVVEQDFLAPGPVGRRFRSVLGNPPYLRFGHLPAPFKELYAQAVPDYARGDLLHAFLDRCAEALTDDGRLACVTADRWLFNESAAELRERIGRRFGIAKVTRLDPATSFYRPKERRAGTPPRVHPVVVLLTPTHRARRPLTREPIYPGDPVDVPESAVPLQEVATVRLAPWLGPHGVFTLDLAAADDLPNGSWVPCVDTEDIVGEVLRAPRRIALRTDREEAPPPKVREHLERTAGRLPPRARRDPFWLPPESWGPFPLDHEALMIPRIARGIRAVRLPAGVLATNHNLTVVSTLPEALDALQAALTSDSSQAWIQQHAPRLENGYLSITTRLLRRLPVALEAPAPRR